MAEESGGRGGSSSGGGQGARARGGGRGPVSVVGAGGRGSVISVSAGGQGSGYWMADRVRWAVAVDGALEGVSGSASGVETGRDFVPSVGGGRSGEVPRSEQAAALWPDVELDGGNGDVLVALAAGNLGGQMARPWIGSASAAGDGEDRSMGPSDEGEFVLASWADFAAAGSVIWADIVEQGASGCHGGVLGAKALVAALVANQGKAAEAGLGVGRTSLRSATRDGGAATLAGDLAGGIWSSPVKKAEAGGRAGCMVRPSAWVPAYPDVWIPAASAEFRIQAAMAVLDFAFEGPAFEGSCSMYYVWCTGGFLLALSMASKHLVVVVDMEEEGVPDGRPQRPSASVAVLLGVDVGYQWGHDKNDSVFGRQGVCGNDAETARILQFCNQRKQTPTAWSKSRFTAFVVWEVGNWSSVWAVLARVYHDKISGVVANLDGAVIGRTDAEDMDICRNAVVMISPLGSVVHSVDHPHAIHGGAEDATGKVGEHAATDAGIQSATVERTLGARSFAAEKPATLNRCSAWSQPRTVHFTGAAGEDWDLLPPDRAVMAEVAIVFSRSARVVGEDSPQPE